MVHQKIYKYFFQSRDEQLKAFWNQRSLVENFRSAIISVQLKHGDRCAEHHFASELSGKQQRKPYLFACKPRRTKFFSSFRAAFKQWRLTFLFLYLIKRYR